MEFLYSNFLDTTTSVQVTSGTDTVAYIFNRDTRYQYATNGYNGATASTFRVNFSETKTVSRIALVDHNMKVFRVYYNGATASTFSLLTGATTASNYSTNSETSIYMQATPIACTSVSIDLGEAMVAGAEKVIGYLVVTEVRHSFSRRPSSKGFKIKQDPQDVVHKLSDGGTRIQNISDKFMVNLSYKYISTSERNSLKAIWDSHSELIYVPFGTTTAWDKVIVPCVWEGAFEFYEYSNDASVAGFMGKINLLETPK